MVWSDGTDVIAGQKIDDVFVELERQPFEWPASGHKRYFDIIDTGAVVIAFIAGQEVMRFEVDPGSVARGVGFFTRNTNKNRFDDFTVWAAPSSLTNTGPLDPDGETGGGEDQVDATAPPGSDGPAAGPGETPDSETASDPASDPGSIARGSEIFGELGCGTCHTVSGRAGAEGTIGPVLDGVGDRAHTRIPGTPAAVYIRESIIDPSAFIVADYASVMPSFDGAFTPGDMDSLVAYLLSLSNVRADGVTGVVDSLIGGREIAVGRAPERGPSGAVWVAEAGDWSLRGSGVIEAGGAQADHRLGIESGIENASVSAVVTWSGGFAGLVARYTDARNWVMAWYDPAGVIVIAIHTDGGFKEIERTDYDWGGPGTAHRLKIDDYGDIVDVWVDDRLIYTFEPGPVPLSSSSGIFSRGHNRNQFSHFAIVDAGDRPEQRVVEPDVDDVAVEDQPTAPKPQVVLPPDPALAPLYVESWRERRKEPHLAGSLDGNDYTLEAVVDEGIAHPISITFGNNGIMYVASGELADLEKGAIYALEPLPGGGFAPPVLMAVGFRRATGLLYANDSLYVSSRGVITRLHDLDGDLVADRAEEIVTDLPFGIFGVKGQATEHQTQGMRLGADGRTYVVQGAVTDRGPITQQYEGTIFSMLADGSDIQVYATGFRNPFDIDFNANGDMFTADNSANVKVDENPPDELHYVRPGGDHGFPDVLGDPPPGSDVEKPLKTWFPAIAPGGLEFYDGGTLAALSPDDMLIAKWNKLEIARLRIELVDGEYVFIEEENVIVGFGTPVTDVTVAPNGDIYVADWGGGRIYRVSP